MFVSIYQIIAQQQQSFSDILPWRSHSGSHLVNNVITGILDTMMLLLILDFEIVLAFVLAVKLHQNLSFQCSHLKSLCNVATSRVFTMKPCQHLSLFWSHANIHLCHEAIFALAHLLWSRTIICLCNEATLALFFCHKAIATFYLHWGHLYTSFILKPCQHLC